MRGYAHKPTVGQRILLVDDNHRGSSVRRVVLEELGYAVTAVCSSAEAYDRFCSETFQLVITGYHMPSLNGIELVRRIRSKKPDVPVVLISGVAETLGLNQHNTGADIIIQKNAHEITSLTRAVLRLLARRTPRKSVRNQELESRAKAAAG